MTLGYVLVVLMKFLVKISTRDLGIGTELHIVAFQDCDLINLGYEGPKYIWSNRQDASTLVKVYLDIPLANDVCQLFECSPQWRI
jgi:hypothetical protein